MFTVLRQYSQIFDNDTIQTDRVTKLLVNIDILSTMLQIDNYQFRQLLRITSTIAKISYKVT